MKPQANHRLQVRTVIVRISRKLKATYRVRRGRLFSDLLVAMMAVFSPLARALPDTATMNVAAGQVTVDPKSTSNSLVLNQGTNKAILDWRSFNIGAGESVRFVQPGTSSVALNRISGGATSIYGALSANGQVFLVNPAGVLFAPGAQVNVGGLVATTLDLSNSDFLDGRYTFSGNSTASVTNQGSLAGRYVVLAGASVSNAGTIEAQGGGSAGLLAGARVTVDPSGAGLVKFSVDGAAVNAAIANSGTIVADGGQVALLASALSDTLPTVINQSGVIRANSIAEQGGTIVLSGGSTGIVQVSGTLEAKGDNAGEKGGTVKVLGDMVGLMAGARVDASGDAGGGTVLVGGNFQGKGVEQNASRTYVDRDASIDASAVTNGDGGKVIVWADDVTRYHGSIAAKGGADGGNGGFVEVSGKNNLAFSGAVDAGAAHGTTGTVLLDPTNINIVAGTGADGAQVADGSVVFADGGGADFQIGATAIQNVVGGVYLQATNNVNVGAAINKVNGGLYITAGNDITVSQNVSTSAFITLEANSSSSGAPSGTGKVTVNSGVTLTGAYISLMNGFSSAPNVVNGSIAASDTINFFNATNVGATASLSAPTLNINTTGAGTVTLGGANIISNTTNVAVQTGTLALGAFSDTVGTVSLTGGSITGTSGILTAGSYDMQNGSVGAILGGTGTLTKSGGGTVTLTRANTYTGATTVNGGTLQLSGGAAIADGGTVTVGAAGTLQVSASEQIATLNSSGTVNGPGTLTATNYNLSGGTVSANLGGGTVTGSASTTLGSTTVGATAVNVTGGTLTLGAGTTLNNTPTINVSGGGTLSLGGSTQTVGATTLADGTIAGGTLSSASNYTVNQGTVSANLQGNGGLTKNTAGTVSLSGTNTYSGGTTVAGGWLALYNGSALADTGAVTVQGGSTLYVGASETVGALTLSNGTIQGGTLTAALTGSSYTVDTGTISAILAGTSGLTKTGTGTVTLSGANTYTGATTINGGTLSVNGSNISDIGAVTVNAGGTLALTGSETVGSLAGVGTIMLGANTLTTGGIGTNTSFDGAIGGTGGLTKVGTGTLTLGGTSNYSGATTVNAGTLSVWGGAVADSSAAIVASGATINLTGAETFGSLAGAGSIVTNGHVLFTGGDNTSTTFSGVISGGGGLHKFGSGNQTLTGVNTYTGATTVAAGTLTLGHATATLSDSTAVSVSSGATLDIGANTDTVASLQLNGTLAGTGTIAAGSYTLNGATVNANLGTGALTQAGGTSTLNGSAATGTVNVAGGTLALGPTADRLTAPSAVTIAVGATLDTGTAAQSFGAATISNSGTLATGADLWASSITGTGGASLGGDVNTTGSQSYGGPVVLTGDATLTAAGVSFGDTVTGAQALTVNTTGSTATTFNGAVNVASLTTNADGRTVVNGGTVTTTGAQNFNDALVLGGNTTLDAGTGDVLFAGGVDGPFALTVTGSGITRIESAVGAGTPLASFTTSGGGITVIGADVTTSGTQTWGNNAVVSQDATVTGTDVTFDRRIDGSAALTVNASGVTTFGGVVNAKSITTDAAGSTVINGGIVDSSNGTQTFNDAVLLGANTVLYGGSGTIAFNSTVDGAFDLTATTSGITIFAAPVGSGTALASLTVNGLGTTTLGGSVTTSGGQNYYDAVTLAAPSVALTSTGGGAILMTGPVDGNASLQVDTSGSTQFWGVVGASSPLASLTTNAGGSTTIAADITTSGAQTYNDNVALAANAILTGSDVSFNGTVGGAQALTVNSGGTTTFGGAVSLGALTTDAAGSTVLSGAIATTGTQTYNDSVVLAGATTLTSSGNAAITLQSATGGGNDLGFASTGGVTAGALTGIGTLTTSSGTNLSATSVDAAGASLGGDVTTTGSQSYTGPLQTAAGATLSATGSLTATDGGNVIGNNTQFAVTQDVGGTGTLDVAGDFAGAVSVSGNATTVSLNDQSAATPMVVASLAAAPSASVTLVSAGAMQVDAAALTPVADLNATTQNGSMVFLNSGTLQAGQPGVLATGALTLNVTGGALNASADPLIVNVGTPLVNITGSPLYVVRNMPPAPVPSAAGSATTQDTAAGVAGTVFARLDDLLFASMRDAAGLLRVERLVFLGSLTPAQASAPVQFRSTGIRLPRCVDEQAKGQPGCR